MRWRGRSDQTLSLDLVSSRIVRAFRVARSGHDAMPQSRKSGSVVSGRSIHHKFVCTYQLRFLKEAKALTRS
jgi:hypothetical protein